VSETSDRPNSDTLSRRHLVFAWCALLLFLSLGLFLEVLNGFKVGWYLDVSNTTRHHMWTLAHAHGTLLSLVNIAYAFTLREIPAQVSGGRALASRCLMAGSLLLPAGFFLGGLVIYAGDPSLGILLVPIGGALLFVAVAITAREAYGAR
jgi:hypothetical protein